jgi:ferredoxin
MSYLITTECINCGACEPECPNSAIYEGGASWELAGNTYGENDVPPSGKTGFWSAEYFYIAPDKCTECKGFHDKPQCAEVCPVDCCVADPNNTEEESGLLSKKEYLDSLGR